MGIEHFFFSEEEIRERIVEHWQLAEDFLEGFQSEYLGYDIPESLIKVNDGRLSLAISSAYHDIARYKNYHQKDPENERLDCVKRCAFLLKWIVRLKPLYVKLPEGGLTEREELAPLEMANEFFALYLFEQHLSIEQECSVEISLEKTIELTYDLVFRQLNQDAWLSIFQLFKDCVVGRAVSAVPFLEEVVIPAQ